VDNCPINRRKFLYGAGTAALAAGLPGSALAQDKGPLAAMAYPGITEEMARTVIAQSFRSKTGAAVNVTPMLAVDAIAKISAARNNPPIDVVMLDDPTALIAAAEGYISKLSLDKVPNARDVPEKLRADGGITQTFQLVGIMYNPKRIQKAPTSWRDLWNPEYKGRVSVIGPDSSLGVAWMVSVAKSLGGSEDDLEPAWKALADLTPSLATIPRSPGALVPLLQQGQIDIAVGALAFVQPVRTRGGEVELARPDTGWSVVLNTAYLVANSPNPGLASAYINEMMDAGVQAKLAAAPYFQFPTNSKVPYEGEIAKYAKGTDELLGMITTDWKKINPQRKDIIDRFNRDVRRG
jgi:putative spermidine/putrescine transport system substrate-binding protein